MIDLLSPSAFTPPSDPADVDGWLAEREEEIAAQVRATLRRIVADAVAAYERSLVAAGDVSAFDTIPVEWASYVTNDLGELVGGMYYGGSLSAFMSSDAERAMSAARANRWADVVNDQAVDYQRTATNRLARVGDGLWTDIRAKTVSALEAGMPTEDLKREIEDITGFSEFRADTIARTETVGAYNAGEYDGAVALGDLGPVEKSWLAAEDRRTRPSHNDADGQTVPFSEPFKVGGVTMMRPHDPGAPAGEVVNCRCVMQLLYEGDTRPDGTKVRAPETVVPPQTTPAPETVDSGPINTAGINFVGSPERLMDEVAGGIDRGELRRRIAATEKAMTADLTRTYDRALSGTGYRTEMVSATYDPAAGASWMTKIVDESGETVGKMKRKVRYDSVDGETVVTVEHSVWTLNADIQGQGIAKKISTAADEWYQATGVQRVTLNANIDVGGYAWARQGYDWDSSFGPMTAPEIQAERLIRRIEVVNQFAPEAARAVTAEQIASARAAIAAGDVPTPFDLSQIGSSVRWTTDSGIEMWTGKEGLLGSSWEGERWLPV